MCVGFYTLEHPNYALILCANRDEYLRRPTDPARFHSFGTPGPDPDDDVLSGIDARAGGTWLGVSRTGKIIFLTNITEEYTARGASRGDLAAYFLASTRPLRQDLDLAPRDVPYAGFNLLLLAPQRSPPRGGQPGFAFDAACVTNHGGGGLIAARPLTHAERTCGGMSNGIDGRGAESWPKVVHGLHAFQSVIDAAAAAASTPEKDIVDDLFELLTWKSPLAPRTRSETRNTIQVDPLIFPGSDGGFYGTRLSTVILVNRRGEVLFIERERWKLLGSQPVLSDPCSQREFRFQLQQVD